MAKSDRVIILPMLAVLFIYLKQFTPNIQGLCHDMDSYWLSVYRDLIHGSFGHLCWTLYGLYDLVPLEQKLGPLWMLVAVIWMLLLTNLIQHHSQRFIKPYTDVNTRYKILQHLSQQLNLKYTQLPCDIGFTGINLGLDILALYLSTRGRLKRSWVDILWLALQITPTLIFNNVTLHSQVSGFTAGVITVTLLDACDIGYN